MITGPKRAKIMKIAVATRSDLHRLRAQLDISKHSELRTADFVRVPSHLTPAEPRGRYQYSLMVRATVASTSTTTISIASTTATTFAGG